MRFLSDEHFAASTAVFLTDAELRKSVPGVDLAIVYFVSDGPDGDFVYHIKIADGSVSMASGDLAERDAEVRSSYETAAKMARAELGNQTAVMMGKVRIKGGMMKLLKNQGVLNRVQALSSALEVVY
jgi:putative sterol carrier protein